MLNEYWSATGFSENLEVNQALFIKHILFRVEGDFTTVQPHLNHLKKFFFMKKRRAIIRSSGDEGKATHRKHTQGVYYLNTKHL